MIDSLLSIVLIAKQNTSINFKRALESALRQTYVNKEIVIVNANEPGDLYSLGLLEDMAGYAGITLLQTDLSGTESFYRNFALLHIDGEYVAFMSGNDYWEPSKAYLQIEQLKTNSLASASVSNGLVCYERPRNVTSEPIFEEISYDMRKWILEKSIRIGSQVVYRIEYLLNAGGFDNRLEYLCDLDMAMCLTGKCNVMFFPVLLFETSMPDETFWLHQYEDGCILKQKYADLLIVNPSIRYNYNLLLAKQALRNHLWLPAISGLFQVFLSEPIHAAIRMTAAICKLISSSVGLLIKYRATNALPASLLYSLKNPEKAPKHGKKHSRNQVLSEVSSANRETWTTFTTKELSTNKMFKFAGNRNLYNIAIPDDITVIRRGSFFNCDQLVSVVIPNTVTSIEAHAFHNCLNLENITFQSGSGLTQIGAYAFAGCKSLTQLTLPGNLLRLGNGAFAECSKLRSLRFTQLCDGEEETNSSLPSSLSIIPKYAFAGCSKLKEAVFDDGASLEKIDTAAFYNCQELETVYLMGELDRIKSYAFASCIKLNNFYIPMIDSVLEIQGHAFENCSSLTDVQIPNAIKRIKVRTYYGCSAIKNVRIPAGVVKIEGEAFGQCTALKTAFLMNAETSYRQSSFPPEVIVDRYKPKSGNDS